MATENLLSKLRGRSSDIDHFVFEVVSETMIFRDRHNILRRIHTNLRYSLSIDIEASVSFCTNDPTTNRTAARTTIFPIARFIASPSSARVVFSF